MAGAKLQKEKIRIRMYRVGFGDGFLVSLPVGDGHRHLLVDCGVHAKGNVGSMDDVIADIEKETGGEIAVVVATHHHQDHISGFARGEETFGRIEAGEVWMPWTEDPKDPQALKLRQKRTALAEGLRTHFAAAGAAPGVAEVLENATGTALNGTASATGSNEKAMAVLRSGFAGDPRMRYLRAGDALEKPAGLVGLTVKVLGPPTDETFLGRMDPPAKHHYLGAAGSANGGAGARTKPFHREWIVPRNRFPKGFSGLSARDESALKTETESSLDGLAFALDQAINNTSLVLLISYRGKTLLFPGDAQWGNWQFWLEQEGADQLLSQICFYKVSHHGSLNATPTDAVERMPSGRFVAMVSTQSTPWASIPRIPLLEALAGKSKKAVVRSDALAAGTAPADVSLKKLPSGVTKGTFWFDYTIATLSRR